MKIPLPPFQSGDLKSPFEKGGFRGICLFMASLTTITILVSVRCAQSVDPPKIIAQDGPGLIRRQVQVEDLGQFELRLAEGMVAAEQQAVTAVAPQKILNFRKTRSGGVGVGPGPVPDAGLLQGAIAAVQASPGAG